MSDVSDDSLPEWTDEERALLRTADDDRPPGRSLPATLAAVSAGGAVTSAAAAAKGASMAAAAKGASAAGATGALGTAKATTLVAITKWVGVAMVGGAVVSGGVAFVRHAERAKETAAAARSEHAQVAREAVPAPAPEPATSVAKPTVTAPERGGEAAANPSAHAPSVRTQPDISSEIAAIDEARTVLRAGKPSEALAALDRYDAKFARGALRVEATALRIEALLGSGKRDRATALANAFLARHAKSPYAARVRALIGEKAPVGSAR
jgi:alpha-beta hydrolase superfamily lysophospholipase